MKFKKSYFFVICLIAGFTAQFLSAYGAQLKNDDKTEQFIPYSNLTKSSTLNYCEEIKDTIKSMATIFYLQHGAWGKEKEITVFFDVYRNGNLDESSISFTKESEDDKVLCNLVFLALKKSFSQSKMPFPKELRSSEKLRFKIKLLFKKEAGTKG
jgi:hypothetical protein